MRLLAAAAAAASCCVVTHAARLSLALNGQPATIGNFSIGDDTTLVFDNGLIQWTFGHRKGGGFQLTQALVNGTQIDDSGEASWYVDWSGGKGDDNAKFDTLRVLRADGELLHVAFADTTNDLIRNELHNIMTAGTRGMYGFNVLTTLKPEGLNEVRFNTRWARCTLNHAYSRERGVGVLPTYAYLYTQEKVQDETWRINGVNDPALPCPSDNSGNLPAGTVYTKVRPARVHWRACGVIDATADSRVRLFDKAVRECVVPRYIAAIASLSPLYRTFSPVQYEWVLYHADNPIWGHWGASADNSSLVGIWFTPLGGITNTTSAASYAVGPQHQDLALHQDGL